MSSKSKTLSAVGYASADIFLQVIRENMTPQNGCRGAGTE